MLQALDALSSTTWAVVAAFAALSCLWSLAMGGLSIAGKRVPPIVALLPTALAVFITACVAMWTAGQLPWDTDTVAMTDRIAMATPDFLARAALFPAIFPGLALLVGTHAIAAPLRGPRTTWPAGVGLLLTILGFLAVTTGAILDLAVAETGVLLFLVGPLALVTLIAMVRGNPDGSGPEASVIATVALGHVVAGGVTAVLAVSRYDQLLAHQLTGDPAAWRAASSGIAVLAVLGMAAAAATGITGTRPRTYAGLGAVGTLVLWVPLAMVGALTQLV